MVRGKGVRVRVRVRIRVRVRVSSGRTQIVATMAASPKETMKTW